MGWVVVFVILWWCMNGDGIDEVEDLKLEGCVVER
jgi:hypothetical protein